MRRASSLLVLVVMFLLPVLALAQDADVVADAGLLVQDAGVLAQAAVAAAAEGTVATVSPLRQLMDQLLAVLTPFVVAVVGLMTTWVLKKLRDRLHLQVSDAQMTSWTQLAEQAALRGAEYARKVTRGESRKPTGDEVLGVAVEWAADMALKSGLPAMSPERLKGLIESQLYRMRLSYAAPRSNSKSAI